MTILAPIADKIVPCGTTYLEAYKTYHNEYIKTVIKKPEHREKQRLYSQKRREMKKQQAIASS